MSTLVLKRCTKCRAELEISCFSKDRTTKDGLQRVCRDCGKARWKSWKSQNVEKLKAYRVANKERLARQSAEWARKNRARRNAQQRARQKADPERRRADEKRAREGRGREKWLEKKRRYALRYPEKVAMNRRHRAGVMAQASVAWADDEKMRAFYIEARRCSKETGINWQVDHIVPLQGETVCGLHNEFNLRVVTEFENKSKKNKFIPELLAA